jgi:hypothetical protein
MDKFFKEAMTIGVNGETEKADFTTRFADILNKDKMDAVKEAYKRGFIDGIEEFEVAIEETRVLDNMIEVTPEEKMLITALRKLSLTELAVLRKTCLNPTISVIKEIFDF